MMTAKEMREYNLKRKCEYTRRTIVEEVVQNMFDTGKFVMAFQKEDGNTLLQRESLLHCKEYLEFMGYNVYENSWEVRLEC